MRAGLKGGKYATNKHEWDLHEYSSGHLAMARTRYRCGDGGRGAGEFE